MCPISLVVVCRERFEEDPPQAWRQGEYLRGHHSCRGEKGCRAELNDNAGGGEVDSREVLEVDTGGMRGKRG